MILIIPCLIGAQENPNAFTLERIYKDKDFELNDFGPAIWLEDGSGYTTLEESIGFPNCKDIIKYDPEYGRKESY